MKIVNKYGHTPCDKDVWIMRNNSPSNGGVALPCLGNPFGESAYAPIRVATREIAVAEYRKWLAVKIKQERNEQIIDALRSIPEDANLVCCCAPKACHGSVIIDACRWLEQHPEY